MTLSLHFHFSLMVPIAGSVGAAAGPTKTTWGKAMSEHLANSIATALGVHAPGIALLRAPTPAEARAGGAAAVAAAAAEAAERRTELEVLLEDCGLASFRAAVAAAAGGETAGHIKALGSKEALMALGMPKIRAVKLWRAVLEVCPKTLLCCRRLGFVCSLPQLVLMP